MPEPFTTESLGAEAFYVVLPARHRLACAKEIELKALKDATLASLTSRTRRIIDGAAATAGFTSRYARWRASTRAFPELSSSAGVVQPPGLYRSRRLVRRHALHNEALAEQRAPRPEPIYYCATGVEMPMYEPCKEMKGQRDI
jgi:hypothetical protein